MNEHPGVDWRAGKMARKLWAESLPLQNLHRAEQAGFHQRACSRPAADVRLREALFPRQTCVADDPVRPEIHDFDLQFIFAGFHRPEIVLRNGGDQTMPQEFAVHFYFGKFTQIAQVQK